jgi:hypothetical protein
MRTKLRERLDGIDIKSVVRTVIILGTLIFIIYKCSDPTDNLPDSLTTRGKGKIISVTPITQMRQSKSGTKISTDSYSVKFSYTVNGVTYKQTDDVKNIGRNQRFIDKMKTTPTDSVDIIYDGKRPTDCKIHLP